MPWKDSARELLRVLAYPKFKRFPEDREDLLSDYLPFAEVVKIPSPPPSVPKCRDPKDAIFLHLAIAGRADALITGHVDWLTLKEAFPILIQTPETWWGAHGRSEGLRIP